MCRSQGSIGSHSASTALGWGPEACNFNTCLSGDSETGDHTLRNTCSTKRAITIICFSLSHLLLRQPGKV